MNFIKGFVTKRKGHLDVEDNAIQKERSLCIQHLRKLFLEFLHPAAPLSQEQQELKQYFMLPLFLKSFSGADPTQLSERFGDVLQFAGHTSKLMVSEVQRRAANKSKENASKDILVFLFQKADETENKGWNLIQTLNILTDGELAIIECMIAASLHSILVKCIRLFFFLPSTFGEETHCIEVQRVVIAILVKLCNHPVTAKELIRTDDLASLFESLTCSCQPNHVLWRTGVSEVLTTITRYCFTIDVIEYINDKSCISLSLANIENICSDDPLAVVEMFVTLTCVLKDSADVSPILLENFDKCHGYQFLLRMLLKFSQRSDEPACEAYRNLVLLVSSLVMTGYEQLQPSQAISAPFQRQEYTIPKPSGNQGTSIRNLNAFKVLMDAFLETSNGSLCMHILNAIQSLLNYDNANYFLVEPLHPFAQFIEKIPEKDQRVKTAILKIVEFVALQLQWIPSQELVAMTILFKHESAKSSQCAVLNTLILLINNNTIYKNVLREAGLVDVMIVALKRYYKSYKESENEDESTIDYLFLLMECLRLLIESNSSNADLFRQHGGSTCTYSLITFDYARPYALRIVQQLIVDGGHDDLATLLGLMHSNSSTSMKLKVDLLSSILHIFDINPQIRSVFQEVGGFVYVVSLLVGLEGSLAFPPVTSQAKAQQEKILELIWMIFNVLTSAMKDDPVNKIIFMDDVRFKGLIDTVKMLGCFSSNLKTLPIFKEESDKATKQSSRLSSLVSFMIPQVETMSRKYVQMVICKTILSMATSNFDTWRIEQIDVDQELHKSSRIYHPTAINGLIELLPNLCCKFDENEGISDVLLYVVCQVQHLMGSEINQQLMCDAGLPLLLLEKCKEAFVNEFHPLNPSLTKLFERLTAQSLQPKVLRAFLRLGSPLCSISAYAVLRGSKQDEVSIPDKDIVDSTNAQSLSLQVLNGDIGLSCQNDRNNQILLEENEFQSIVDEDGQLFSGSSYCVNSNSSLLDFEPAKISNDFPYDETDNIRDSPALNGEAGSKETLGSENKNSENYTLSNVQQKKSCVEESIIEEEVTDSAINAVNRIEYFIDEAFDAKENTHDIDIANQISKICDHFEGRPLPQSLVKCVVSLTTPRDVLSTAPLEPPAFVEFSLQEDGHACLFIPALAPQIQQVSHLNSFRTSVSSASLNLSLASSIASNIERVFPPPTGFSYSAWICLETIPSVPSSHSSVSLFTVERQWEEIATKRIINSSIFQLYIDLKKRFLVINTEDQHASDRVGSKGKTNVTVELEELLLLHKWNHLCVVLNKSVMRTSTVTVFVNGRQVIVSKIKYVQQTTPAGADINSCKTYAFVGTHPKHCHISDLVWRLGPLSIFEDSLTSDIVSNIFALGPSYIGSFQAPSIVESFEEDVSDVKLGPLLNEEKILLVLNPHNFTLTTLLKLSNQCGKSDLDILAAEVNISCDDKHTPIQLLPNSSLHLAGGHRPIGLFLISSNGLRIFCPNPVASAFVSIGGMSILLCLIAMVTQLSELYASLKALTCILQSSQIGRREMNRVEGYQILAFLLKKKKSLLNTHILHLVFSLVGTVRSDSESATIPNIRAFDDLLCDLEIWHDTPSDLDKSLFSHFYELITQGRDQSRNIECLRKLDCVSQLIHVIQKGDVNDSTLNVIASVLSVLLSKTDQQSDVLILGQYLAFTLPTTISESDIELDAVYQVGSKDEYKKDQQKIINQRNTLLDVLIHLLHGPNENLLDIQFCEQLYNTLGFDWVLLFLYGNIHRTSVVRALRILVRMLSSQSALNNFQAGIANGGWLFGSDTLTSKKSNVAAGFNVTGNEDASAAMEHEVNHQSYKQNGIPLLGSLLEEHCNVTEVYFLLLSLLIKTKNLSGFETGLNLNIETLNMVFWPATSNEKIDKLVHVYCLDAIIILLGMLRRLMGLHQDEESMDVKGDIPSTIIQFLQFLYTHLHVIEQFCYTQEFIKALVATLFPLNEDKYLEDFSVEAIDTETDGGLQIDRLTLCNHQCKNQVINFLKKLVVDHMLKTAGKLNAFVDMVFQASPPTSSYSQQQQFLTELISAIITEYTGGVGATWKPVIGSPGDNTFSKVLLNGVALAVKIVDKLWQGYFVDSYKVLVNYMLHIIQHMDGSILNMDSIYHSLNRIILYQFARPASRITDQTNLLELLHVLTSNSKIIFSSNNRDSEFISGLTHWLIVVGLPTAGLSERRLSFSSVVLENLEEESVNEINFESKEDVALSKLIAAASERVWNVFYTYKKDSIEEIFGIQSSFISYDQNTPVPAAGRTIGLTLSSAKRLVGDHAAKCWINFVANEERKKNEHLAMPLQRQGTRKASSKWPKTLKREKITDDIFTIQETLDWIGTHSKAVKALVKMRHTKHVQEDLLRNNMAEKNWSNMELELIREGGIWGPFQSNHLEKWMLGDMEGPYRMRKRMIRNDMFYTHYPYFEQEKEQQSSKHRCAYSTDSKLLFDYTRKYVCDGQSNDNPRTIEEAFTWKPQLYSVDGFKAEDSVEEVNTQTIIQLLETGEKIYSMYRCARVRGLDSSEGLFLFGRNHFYVVDGFTLMSADQKGGNSNAKEIKDISSLPENSHEPLIPFAKGNSTLKRSFSKWPFEDIKEAHKRRYLLQDVAIEVFSTDGSNHLLVFPKPTARNKVYNRIIRVSPALANSQESVVGMSTDVDVETGQSLLSSWMTGEKSVTQRWIRGEITNFQYLTFLNTLAGRSYNDLMQYPIFPWVLADYTSEFLDLTNPATFRDLSKPMGAQGAERLENYRKRYREWEDPTGKTPAYYYGTHYSSAMIVASYLIRLEPFTQHFLRLQGGHFDLPDRLFHSIKDSWTSASSSNMADIKELIPEFFYLPEFLKNSNHFDLGTKQNGERLDDVILPPWAKGDTTEFIRLHREALECDYVSSHLHEWIDLVFGFKQQGEAAIEADNVFHHLFYEKSVDLDNISDPLERKATIGFINNFGQMPKQLFKKAHPAKKTVRSQDFSIQTGTLPSHLPSTSNDKLFFHNLNCLVPSVTPVKEIKSAVGEILSTEKSIYVSEFNKASFPVSNNKIGWGYGDFSLRYFSSDDKLLAVFENVFTGQMLCASCLGRSSFASGGTSTAVCVWEIDQKRDKTYKLNLLKVLYGHQGAVLCIVVSTSYNIIISGSEDKTCIIWDLKKLTYTRRMSVHQGGPVSCISINSLTGDIVTCAGTYLYVWTVNAELLVQENTSQAISGQILCCTQSQYNEWDQSNVILTGSTDGLVKIWCIEFFDTVETGKTSMKLESEQSNLADLVLSNVQDVPSPSKQTSELQDYLLVQHPVKRNRVWKRHLVLKHKLTMHTAFNRSDNNDPASVTALAISKDHRKVYVGDSRGRIFSWSMSDSVGRLADHWVKDEVADNCNNCSTKFNFTERKHHCRNCGNVFCGKCSRYESPVVHLRIFKAVRVCVKCYHKLKRRPSILNQGKR